MIRSGFSIRPKKSVSPPPQTSVTLRSWHTCTASLHTFAHDHLSHRLVHGSSQLWSNPTGISKMLPSRWMSGALLTYSIVTVAPESVAAQWLEKIADHLLYTLECWNDTLFSQRILWFTGLLFHWLQQTVQQLPWTQRLHRRGSVGFVNGAQYRSGSYEDFWWYHVDYYWYVQT